MSLFLASCPYFEVLVRREYTRNLKDRKGEWLTAKAIAVECCRGRMLGFQVLLTGEDEKGEAQPTGGAMFRLPIEALAWKPCVKPEPAVMAPWDCLSDEFAVVVLDLLRDIRMVSIPSMERGRYLFTVHPGRSELTDDPEQMKQMHVCAMDGGWFAALPNTRMLIEEPAFYEMTKEAPDFIALAKSFSSE